MELVHEINIAVPQLAQTDNAGFSTMYIGLVAKLVFKDFMIFIHQCTSYILFLHQIHLQNMTFIKYVSVCI